MCHPLDALALGFLFLFCQDRIPVIEIFLPPPFIFLVFSAFVLVSDATIGNDSDDLDTSLGFGPFMG
jgi:hypothetical protein